MAPRGKMSARSVDAWLIAPDRASDPQPQVRPNNGAAVQAEPKKSPGKRTIGPAAAQWLLDQGGGQNGQATEAVAGAESANATPKAPERPRKEPETAPEEDLELREARTALAEQQARIGQLEEALAQRERELTGLEEAVAEREAGFEKTLQKRQAQIEELQAQLADAKLGAPTVAPKPPRRGGSKRSSTLDLNGITFEQLRELGLSVTQCARVISCRDTRRGFDSLEELDEVPGLPKDIRHALKSQLTCSRPAPNRS